MSHPNTTTEKPESDEIVRKALLVALLVATPACTAIFGVDFDNAVPLRAQDTAADGSAPDATSAVPLPGSCLAGRADCNGNAADGCETNTNTSPLHCGGCGAACKAGLVCSKASCAESCESGATACSGACVDLTTDRDNCGGCGKACGATPNGVASCVASTCTLACDVGFVREGAACVPDIGADERRLTAGAITSCGIRPDDTVGCWGTDLGGLAGTFRQISLGAGLLISGQMVVHGCAVKTDGTLACIGNGALGQSTAPAGVFTHVSAGGGHTCAVKSDASIACWGANNHGQINAPAGAFLQVAAGTHHTCGLKVGGAVTCWGDNSSGQSNAPPGVFRQVSLGSLHTCGIKMDGSIACWGDNTDGKATAPAGTYRQLNAGTDHACAVRSDSVLVCWGDNFEGMLNAPAGPFREVSCGADHTCGVRTNGSVACWGNNLRGQLNAPGGLLL